MRTETRLKKIEEATGINEPCAVCEHIDSLGPRIAELAARLGVHLSEAFGPEMAFPCSYCFRVAHLKAGGFGSYTRGLFERLHAALDAGTLCAPENSALWDEINAACDKLGRAEWGEHFPALRALEDDHRRELKQICARLLPRKIYLCRVPACGCTYPKTEEEWRANASKRQAA